MKAVLLAAGRGSRLGELTRRIPKPLIEYRGKPLIQHNIELCVRYGVKDIFINTHYLPDSITEFCGDGSKFSCKIQYSFEPELLGTAGALNNFRNSLFEPFFVLYSDNVTTVDLGLLVEKYRFHQPMGVIAFHYRDDVTMSGVGELDDKGRVSRFIEKPRIAESESHWVNAGIYYLNPKILDYIPQGSSDFGRDIFLRLLRENILLYGLKLDTDVKAFDTPEMYREALE